MADQLFPVFDLPEIPDDPEYEERYRSSVAFDFDKGDFVRDGSNKMVRADGREAFMQWCWKVIQTEMGGLNDDVAAKRKVEDSVMGVAIEAEMQGFIYGFKVFEILLNRELATA